MNIICISAHAFIVLYVVILICTIQVNDNLEHCLYFVYPLDYFGDFYHHIVPRDVVLDLEQKVQRGMVPMFSCTILSPYL